MKEYTHDSPVFHNSIQITEPTDTSHADNINAGPKQLLENTLALRNMINSLKNQVAGMGSQGSWEYASETLTWSAGSGSGSGSGGGVTYDPDTESLIMVNGSGTGGGNAAGIAEQAAAIVESSISEISSAEVSRLFN